MLHKYGKLSKSTIKFNNLVVDGNIKLSQLLIISLKIKSLLDYTFLLFLITILTSLIVNWKSNYVRFSVFCIHLTHEKQVLYDCS